jgi:hypothetical protein
MMSPKSHSWFLAAQCSPAQFGKQLTHEREQLAMILMLAIRQLVGLGRFRVPSDRRSPHRRRAAIDPVQHIDVAPRDCDSRSQLDGRRKRSIRHARVDR